jgi:hypothetical protein
MLKSFGIPAKPDEEHQQPVPSYEYVSEIIGELIQSRIYLLFKKSEYNKTLSKLINLP